MKILVEMAFDYGTQKFSSGVHECNDVNIIRHIKRFNYGTLIDDTPVAKEDSPVIDKPIAKPVATKKRTYKKRAKK